MNSLIILAGWPALIAAVVSSGFGIAQGRPRLLLLGALLSIPFSFYLAATPRLPDMVGLFPFCHFLGALAVQYDYRWLAVVLLVLFGVGFWGLLLLLLW